MKIFGIGLSRTGTTSLTEALRLLGYKAIHFPSDPLTIEELMSGNYRLSILKEYDAVLDIVVAPFYQELDRAFPDSKFILTIRDVNEWLKSVERHFKKPKRPGLRKPFVDFIRTTTYGALSFDESRFRSAFLQHQENVLQYFKDRHDDLLVLDVCGGEGWEILCPFLGCADPGIPFPKKNHYPFDFNTNLNYAIESIYKHIPETTEFVLISPKRATVIDPRWKPLFFFDGDPHWGLAPDSQTAVAELERLRDNGARFLVFLSPSYWWLNQYDEFHSYLANRYFTLVQNESLLIFDLSRRLKS